MMNDDVLRNIEYLREKADVSYEEASDLLERYDGNVMRVLVELERQGRVYPQGAQAEYERPHYTHEAHKAQHQQKHDQARHKAEGFFKQALQHRIVVESGNGESKKTIANLSAPYCAGAALLAPWVAVGSVALMFGMGYRVRLKKEAPCPMPESVESFVDQTVSNIKKTASSFAETAKNEKEKNNRHDDDDEGGEITIE